MKLSLLALALLLAVPFASAQKEHAHPGGAKFAHTHASHSAPYGGLQSRTIKALSSQHIADLREGKGLSYALPAELNGYPGPAHVLELAEQLGLSQEQRMRTQVLHEQMQTQAKTLGEEVIASEYRLDQLFKNKQENAALVEQATMHAASAQARLRATHLQYHLEMMEVLAPAQVERYNALRGY